MSTEPKVIAAVERDKWKDTFCPFCDAVVTTVVNWISRNPTFDFACGTEQTPGGFVRSNKCYETQLAAQAGRGGSAPSQAVGCQYFKNEVCRKIAPRGGEGVMEDKCPFCGSKSVFNLVSDVTSFDCGTDITPEEAFRSGKCYTAQLATQAALIVECLEVVRALFHLMAGRGDNIDGQLELLLTTAAALLPRLEAAKEKP